MSNGIMQQGDNAFGRMHLSACLSVQTNSARYFLEGDIMFMAQSCKRHCKSDVTQKKEIDSAEKRSVPETEK